MTGITFKDPEDTARFQAGQEWHSLDAGKTWKKGPLLSVVEYSGDRPPEVLVIRIDHRNGEITVGVDPWPPSF